MALSDKIEAVKGISEAGAKPPVNQVQDLERVAPNKEQFQTLMNSAKTIVNPAVVTDRAAERRVLSAEEMQKAENNPTFGDENVSVLKNGTATDQERKRQQSSAVEGVESTGRTKKSEATTGSGSLMDEVAKLNKNVAQMSQMKPEAIKKQAGEIITQFEQAKTKLGQAQGEIKPSYQTLLRNRLSHIDDNIKIALSKAGVEYTPPQITTETTNPVKKFLLTLTDSQRQLENLQSSVERMSAAGKEVSPMNMIAIQMKMSQVQQQLELFSNLLNKALESIKTVMNVQV